MTTSDKSNPNNAAGSLFPVILVILSLLAIVASFVLASSVQEYSAKSRGFSVIIVGYLTSCLVVHFFSIRRNKRSQVGVISGVRSVGIDSGLREIEEASRYFSGSLNSADMIRLVSSRINDILPFTTSVLLIVDRAASRFRVVHAVGENADRFMARELPLDEGICGRCLSTKLVQVDRGVTGKDNSFPFDAVSSFRSSAVLPLIRSGEVFAVLQFYAISRTAFDGEAIATLEAVGERVTPMIISSLSFEKSLSKALTDPITDLPNERAFLLVLENQIAESQRDPDSRPLTILAMDICQFDEMNSKYGHAAGDRVLGMVASAIKGQLRQMDFFARSSNDEFLAILPTANGRIAEEVIARINAGLFTGNFFVNTDDPITPELNFGIAAFGVDGESPESLVRAARLRKQQSKVIQPQNVLWFPKEIVN